MRVLKRLAVVAAVVMSMSACGGGGDESPEGLDGRTIGVVQPAPSSELLARQADALVQGGEEFGWDVVVKNGETTPQRWAADIQAFVSQRVDAIVIIGFDPTTVAPQLQTARDAGIPVIQTVVTIGEESAGLVDGHYNMDYAALGEAMGEYAAEKVPDAVVVAQDVTITPAVQDFNDAFDETVKAEGGTGIVGRIDLNVAEPVVQAHGKNLTTLLNAHRDANVYVAGGDNALVSISSVLSQVDRPGMLYVSSYQNPSSLELIASGMNAAVVAVNQDRTAFQAIDVLAAHFQDGTEIPDTYPGDEQKTAVVDGSNVADGDPFPTEAELATWVEKWKADYGI